MKIVQKIEYENLYIIHFIVHSVSPLYWEFAKNFEYSIYAYLSDLRDVLHGIYTNISISLFYWRFLEVSKGMLSNFKSIFFEIYLHRYQYP